MGRMINMNGRRFGALTVVGAKDERRFGQVNWLCRCDCGRLVEHTGGRLRRGGAKSCGCRKSQLCAEVNIRHGDSARGRMTPEYRAWSNMIDRCERPANRLFAAYGGRGISVCATWRVDFASFLRDMGRRPSAGHSLDRIDNDGNYEPGNCRWATRKVQNQNRRSRVLITAHGMTLHAAEWAKRVGIAKATITMRIKRGLTGEAAVAPAKVSVR